MTPLPNWIVSSVTPTKTAPWSCSCSVTIWQWVSHLHLPAHRPCVLFPLTVLSSLYSGFVEFRITCQTQLNILDVKGFSCACWCVLIPVFLALFAAVDFRFMPGWRRGFGTAASRVAPHTRKQKRKIFTSHQPKLFVWMCLHIHAQICMCTPHSQCVKYSLCVQIHWSVCVLIERAPPQRR